MKQFKDFIDDTRFDEEGRLSTLALEISFVNWIDDRTVEQAVAEYYESEGLWQLANHVQVNHRKLVLAAGLCAQSVTYCMKHWSSLHAVDAAIQYGKGLIDRNTLDRKGDSAHYPTTENKYGTHYSSIDKYKVRAMHFAAVSAFRACNYYHSAPQSESDRYYHYSSAALACSAAAFMTYEKESNEYYERANNEGIDGCEICPFEFNDSKTLKEYELLTAKICRDVLGQDIIYNTNELLKGKKA